MSGRKEIADILEQFAGLPRSEADHLAGMIVAAGYAKVEQEDEELTVYGYCVVNREGKFIKDFGQKQQEAIDFAAHWTKDAKDAGIDFDYRVAAIVDQGGL